MIMKAAGIEKAAKIANGQARDGVEGTVAAKAFASEPGRFRLRLLSAGESRHFAALADSPALESVGVEPGVAGNDDALFSSGGWLRGENLFRTLSGAMAEGGGPLLEAGGLGNRILELARGLSPPAVTTRHLHVQIAPPQGGALNVELMLRGEELHVTLRVADGRLADRLKAEAGELVHRLGRAEVHGASKVQVNVVVDPQAVQAAARPEAAQTLPGHQQGASAFAHGQGTPGGPGEGGHSAHGSGAHHGRDGRAPAAVDGNPPDGDAGHDDRMGEGRGARAGSRRLYL
jgi:hypothetical protein